MLDLLFTDPDETPSAGIARGLDHQPTGDLK
jgi:hypothetical protein